jgi:hypothetical protein
MSDKLIASIELITLISEQDWPIHKVAHKMIEKPQFLTVVTSIMFGFSMYQADDEFFSLTLSLVRLMASLAKHHGACDNDQTRNKTHNEADEQPKHFEASGVAVTEGGKMKDFFEKEPHLIQSFIRSISIIKDKFFLTHCITFLSAFASNSLVQNDPIFIKSTVPILLDLVFINT